MPWCVPLGGAAGAATARHAPLIHSPADTAAAASVVVSVCERAHLVAVSAKCRYVDVTLSERISGFSRSTIDTANLISMPSSST